MWPGAQRPPPSQLTPHLVSRTCPGHRSCSFLVPAVDPLLPLVSAPSPLLPPVRGSEVSRSWPSDRDTSSVSEEGARSDGPTTTPRHHHKSRKTASQGQKRGVNRDANLSRKLSRHATGSTTRSPPSLALHRRSPWRPSVLKVRRREAPPRRFAASQRCACGRPVSGVK
jgi:hypothetical protein